MRRPARPGRRCVREGSTDAGEQTHTELAPASGILILPLGPPGPGLPSGRGPGRCHHLATCVSGQPMPLPAGAALKSRTRWDCGRALRADRADLRMLECPQADTERDCGEHGSDDIEEFHVFSIEKAAR